ncbi:MAG: MerR family transcriptional regulator [Deltaproteobacteria bacterium]|jgi:DNA-binding transcriptional MerR regulator|nr:MerR family transcriptional regulator [Deltaproteobacteria bacterium]
MLLAMWSIAEVCERAGLSPRTVRYYEEIGLLPGVRRRAGGRRVYGADELERLRFISRLKALGLSLAEIAELNAVYAIGGSTAAMLERLRDLLGAHLEDVDQRITELGDLRSELARYGQRIEERLANAAKEEAPREVAAEIESASQVAERSRG